MNELRLRRAGVRWVVAPEFAAPLDRVLATAGTTVKETPAKLVTRVAADGQVYYVKRYLNTAAWLRPFKYWFKPSEARSEWAVAQRYVAAAVPVVAHLAYGERWSGRGLLESVMVTAGFDGLPLSRSPWHQRPDVQSALAALLRRSHDAGILQSDLHHNILVRPEPLALRRIDVDRTEPTTVVTEAQRLENLAYLNVFVPLSDSFFAAYGSPPEFAAQVRRRSAVLHRAVALRRSRRCLEHNVRFAPVDAGGMRWWVRRESLDDRLRALLADPDGALASCTHLFKSGPNRQATIGAFDGLVLKRYNQKNRWNYLKDVFRPARALRAYQRAYHLELLGLPTPRPVAAAERRRLRVVRCSYLITEEVREAISLRTATTVTPARARQAGELIGRLHAAGFSHGDLKETNLVWNPTGELFLLDLDGLRHSPGAPESERVEDLARLARGVAKSPLIGPGHRRAFLRAYCRVRGLRPKRIGTVIPRAPRDLCRTPGAKGHD